MKSRPLILDIKSWTRVSSKELQFFATDEEMFHWLTHDLPSDYAPYSLVASVLVKRQSRVYQEVTSRHNLSTYLDCVADGRQRTGSLWLCSDCLSPDLFSKLQKVPSPKGICSTNGLIMIQPGGRLKEGCGASRVSIVDKVRNSDTGETRVHDNYLAIYKALSRNIQRALVYSTIQRFPDGTEFEDTRLQKMTEAAARAHESGNPYSSRPGRILKTTGQTESRRNKVLGPLSSAREERHNIVSRGVHFGLTDATAKRLLEAHQKGRLSEIQEILQDVEEKWDERYLAESDKSWEILHRCFSDGTLSPEGGDYPLNHCFLGGLQLVHVARDGYVASLKTRDQVKDIAAALAFVDQAWIERRLDELDAEDNLDYAWSWFHRVRKLYMKLAREERAVIFTVNN